MEVSFNKLMVFIRIIKGGFYKYRSYRDKKGKVKTEYLGKTTKQDYFEKQRSLVSKKSNIKSKEKKKSFLKKIFGK